MKAWKIYGANNVKLEELTPETAEAGKIKIKLTRSSLSLTDKLMYDGSLFLKDSGRIIGRQGVGMVTEVGEGVTNFARGDRVAIDSFKCCHACPACEAGKMSECEQKLIYGFEADGFMRDFAVVSASDAYHIPDRVKDDDAVFLEHVAMAVNTVSRLNLDRGEHLVIVGGEEIGLILAQVAMYYQAVPILVDTRADRLEIAKNLGIYYTVNCVEEDAYKRIFSLTGGRLAEAVAFVSTTQMPFLRSLDYTAKGGRFAVVGWAGYGNELNGSFKTVLNNQLSVYGVSNGGKNMPSAINLIANSAVKCDRLISKEIDFNDVGANLAEQQQYPHKYISVVVKI